MEEPVSVDALRHELEELRASRARIAEGADAERRRVERELHDGVQQHLVALAVNLQLARELAEAEPAAARTLLEEMSQDVRDALDGVRALAGSVYPPLLLDRGLADALRGAATAAGIATQVEAQTTDRFPPHVEATAFFCCVAALQDAAEQTGGAARATVRLRPEPEALRFEVVVDGAVWQPGEALATTLSDRLGAVEGSVSAVAGPGGDGIAGSIPLER